MLLSDKISLEKKYHYVITKIRTDAIFMVLTYSRYSSFCQSAR